MQLVALHSDAQEVHVSVDAALDNLEEISPYAFVHTAKQLLAVVYNM